MAEYLASIFGTEKDKYGHLFMDFNTHDLITQFIKTPLFSACFCVYIAYIKKTKEINNKDERNFFQTHILKCSPTMSV